MTLPTIATLEGLAPAAPAPANGSFPAAAAGDSQSPGAAASGSRSPGVRHEQSSDQARRIAAALQEIQALSHNPALAQQLAAYGYGAARLAEGLALHKAAQDAYQARQQALGEQQTANAELRRSRQVAFASYRDFRARAGTAFAGASERTALLLSGRAPDSRQLLLTQARAAYGVARQPAYAPGLARLGFGAAQLAAAAGTLDALDAAINTKAAVDQRARAATTARNTAVTALGRWMRSFRKVRALAQRSLPGVSAVRSADAALSPPAENGAVAA